MSSIVQSFQKRTQALPVSQTGTISNDQTIRRRLSSLSLKIQPISIASSPASTWILRRSKSVSSIGESAGSSVRKWWDWGWGWILSRKPIFATDLEMNEEETIALGYQSKGSWRHVFYKVRYELKRLIRSDHLRLPQTYKYDSFNYSKNFDDGNKI